VKKLFAWFILICLAVAGWLLFSLFVPPGPASQQLVELKPHTNTRQIAATLEHAGAIRSANAFLVYHYTLGRRTLKAGEYDFSKPAGTIAVYNRIARGEVASHGVVIPEGFNMFDVANALDQSGVCKKTDFLNYVRTDVSLIADLDPEARTLEGYLFPDTYNFSVSQTPHDIAAIMVKRFRQEAAKIGLKDNIHRTVTLASIVEKETRLDSERPLVAGVFENRIAEHIGLATDPTVIYASLLRGKFDGTIRQSDLQLDSPYNTYKYAGLPPGPISNPGITALQAAMHPTQTDYLYFVANNAGGHTFARTIEEHNHNVAEYRKGHVTGPVANSGKR
jgi:UPF0755 protein